MEERHDSGQPTGLGVFAGVGAVILLGTVAAILLGATILREIPRNNLPAYFTKGTQQQYYMPPHLSDDRHQ